jgi:hypothetical protein
MRSSIITAIVAASFVLTVSTAMAVTPENPIPEQARAPHAPAARYVAARRTPVRDRLDVDVAQFVHGMLGGGPIPYGNLVRDARSMPASGGSFDWSSSPSDDTSPAASSAASDAQAASDAINQSIQQMNDINALNASMAAAEEQNDEANAATLQTEINAGM